MINLKNDEVKKEYLEKIENLKKSNRFAGCRYSISVE